MLLVDKDDAVSGFSGFHVHNSPVGILHWHSVHPAPYPSLREEVQHVTDFFWTADAASCDAAPFPKDSKTVERGQVVLGSTNLHKSATDPQ